MKSLELQQSSTNRSMRSVLNQYPAGTNEKRPRFQEGRVSKRVMSARLDHVEYVKRQRRRSLDIYWVDWEQKRSARCLGAARETLLLIRMSGWEKPRRIVPGHGGGWDRTGVDLTTGSTGSFPDPSYYTLVFWAHTLVFRQTLVWIASFSRRGYHFGASQYQWRLSRPVVRC